MFCRNCGTEINDKAEFCTACGCSPFSDNKYCQECGVATNPKQEMCIKCGVRLKTSSNSGSYNNYSKIIQGDSALNLDFSTLSPYYQAEFTKIYESHESYKGKWNWCSFLFSGIWALTKGVWLSLLIAIIASVLTYGVGGFIYGFVTGARGNYMYYNAYVKKKQLFI